MRGFKGSRAQGCCPGRRILHATGAAHSETSFVSAASGTSPVWILVLGLGDSGGSSAAPLDDVSL